MAKVHLRHHLSCALFKITQTKKSTKKEKENEITEQSRAHREKPERKKVSEMRKRKGHFDTAYKQQDDTVLSKEMPMISENCDAHIELKTNDTEKSLCIIYLE